MATDLPPPSSLLPPPFSFKRLQAQTVPINSNMRHGRTSEKKMHLARLVRCKPSVANVGMQATTTELLGCEAASNYEDATTNKMLMSGLANVAMIIAQIILDHCIARI